MLDQDLPDPRLLPRPGQDSADWEDLRRALLSARRKSRHLMVEHVVRSEDRNGAPRR